MRQASDAFKKAASDAENEALEHEQEVDDQRRRLDRMAGIIQSLVSKRIITGKVALK